MSFFLIDELVISPQLEQFILRVTVSLPLMPLEGLMKTMKTTRKWRLIDPSFMLSDTILLAFYSWLDVMSVLNSHQLSIFQYLCQML